MSIRNLSSDFVFYGLLDLLQRSIGLLMVPLYTRVLNQAEYGVLDLVLVVSSIIFVFVDLQFLAGVARLFFEFQQAGKSAILVGTAICARLILGCLVVGVIVFAGACGALEFASMPSFQGNLATWITVCATIPLTLTFDVLLLQTRLLRFKTAYASGALISALVSAVASVLFVTHAGLGVAGVALGLLIGKLFALFPLGYALRHDIALRLDRRALKELTIYSLPLVPGRWVNHISAYLGRFFVFGQLGSEQNAILAVCTRIASAIGLYSVSFRSAWEPLAMSYIGNEHSEVFYVRSMRLFAAGGLFFVLLLSASIDMLLTVLAPASYRSVADYFPIFGVAALIGECESNLQLGNQIARKTIWITISSIAYLAVNVTILVTLTHTLGVFATGLGLAISAMVKAHITYASAQRHHRIGYDVRAFMMVALGSILALGFASARHVEWISAVTFDVLLVVLALWLPWRVLLPDERTKILSAITEQYRQKLQRTKQ